MSRFLAPRLFVFALATLIAATATAQLTLPNPGGSQRASVSQQLGLVKVSIDYGSPRVKDPSNGQDRHGQIWGKLVPYGLTDLGYGTCKQCPWRAGANENTTFTVSDDVDVEGQRLSAGTYALFMIADPAEWTVIFSKNHTSWGSFFYEPSEDALRVKVKPRKSDYHEWLTYDFVERSADKATVALEWEDLAVPITLSVPDSTQLYLTSIRNELRGEKGEAWQAHVAAARFALEHKVALPEALRWATSATNTPFVGQENFVTLMTLADVQEANGMAAESKQTRDKALHHPTASSTDLHQYARQRLAKGDKQEALAVWKLNAQQHGDAWPVNVGLARGYSANGDYKQALKYAKLALAQAPDDVNRKGLEAGIRKLEAGTDMN
jgi:hypothetical protein